MPTLCSLVFALAPLATFADGSPSLKLTGRVLAPDGTPCAGAQVFLGSPTFGFPVVTELESRAESDARGEFAVRVSDAWIARTSYKRLTLWVWKSGCRLAAAVYNAADVPVGKRVELRLAEPAACALEFVDPDGQPVAGACHRVFCDSVSKRRQCRASSSISWSRFATSAGAPPSMSGRSPRSRHSQSRATNGGTKSSKTTRLIHRTGLAVGRSYHRFRA
jgi:hypothetical protein